MYIPFNESNEKNYCYDINSLYPFIMQDKLMPTGPDTLFKKWRY